MNDYDEIQYYKHQYSTKNIACALLALLGLLCLLTLMACSARGQTLGQPDDFTPVDYDAVFVAPPSAAEPFPTLNMFWMGLGGTRYDFWMSYDQVTWTWVGQLTPSGDGELGIDFALDETSAPEFFTVTSFVVSPPALLPKERSHSPPVKKQTPAGRPRKRGQLN